MDKTSVKILRYIKRHGPHVSAKVIEDKFGKEAKSSISYLESQKYIKSQRRLAGPGVGGKPVFLSTGIYEIDSLGRDFLQHKFGNDFDRWLNRISIILSILGGALLSKPLWTAIEWLVDWISQLSG